MPTTTKPIVDAPGRVNNPFFPYAWVWVEDGSAKNAQGKTATKWTEITMENDRPQRLMQFDFHRLMPGGNRVSLTIFDETWNLIPNLVVSASNCRIQWQYGYAEPG